MLPAIMAFGSALRSSTIDYIRPVDIEILRRDVDLILNELFSRDADIRLGGLRSLGALGLGGLGEPEAVDVVRRYVLPFTGRFSLPRAKSKDKAAPWPVG